jgi:hypothetical protein
LFIVIIESRGVKIMVKKVVFAKIPGHRLRTSREYVNTASGQSSWPKKNCLFVSPLFELVKCTVSCCKCH